MKNDYDFRSSKFYYVLRPFNLDGFSINYIDDGAGKITRTFQTTKPLNLKFRDLYFQEFGKYEFWSRGVEFNLSPARFSRIEDVRLDLKKGLGFSTKRTLLNIYKGKGHQIDFPNGINFNFTGLNDLKFMKNEAPQFDSIYINGNISQGIIKDLQDSTDIVSIDNADFDFQIFKNSNGNIDYKGIVTAGKFEPKLPNESKLISQFLNGAYLTFDKLEIDNENKLYNIEGLQIRIPKKTVIGELQTQLHKAIVKDYGRVSEIKLRFKRRLGPFKFSKTIAKIGIYARVNDIRLKSFHFSGQNKFEFNLGGSVTIYRPAKAIFPKIQDTKRIRTAKGYGTIDIDPKGNISECIITVNTNYHDGQVDIENFPGELEKGVGGVRKGLGKNLRKNLSFSPFKNASSEQKNSLKKIKLLGKPRIEEDGNYYIFTTSAQIDL